MSEEFMFVIDNIPNLVFGFPGNRPGGLLMSLLLATVGVGIGLILGAALGAGLGATRRWIRIPTKTGVSIIRGIPLVLLLLLVHQILGNRTTPLKSAFVTLVLYSSAYFADVLLAGLRAVPSQLVEDAQLLGAGRWRIYRSVTLPYGFRVMQPALTTQAITVFKDTSVVVILGVADLTTTARVALGSDVANSPFWVSTYLTVGALYFVTAFGLSRVALRVERRLSRHTLMGGLA